MKKLIPLVFLGLAACQPSGEARLEINGHSVAVEQIDITPLSYREKIVLLRLVDAEQRKRYGLASGRDKTSKGLSVAAFVPVLGLSAYAANIAINLPNFGIRDLRVLQDSLRSSAFEDLADVIDPNGAVPTLSADRLVPAGMTRPVQPAAIEEPEDDDS